MHRLGKILLGSTAAVALVAGVMTLSTTQASAQVDIDGLIRGALAHYGGHYRGHRGRHEARHGRHHKEREAKDAGSGKDKHHADKGDQADAKPDRKEFSSHPKDNPDTKTSSTNPPPTPPPPQPKAGGDVPSFTPEK